MDTTHHRFAELFAQLGLPFDTGSIQTFLLDNSPLNDCILLEEAPCWTTSQSAFLREKIELDADWVHVVDQLNVALRGPHMVARMKALEEENRCLKKMYLEERLKAKVASEALD